MFDSDLVAEHIVIPFLVTVFGGAASELLVWQIKAAVSRLKKAECWVKPRKHLFWQ